jgi:hypothetical protein
MPSATPSTTCQPFQADDCAWCGPQRDAFPQFVRAAADQLIGDGEHAEKGNRQPRESERPERRRAEPVTPDGRIHSIAHRANRCKGEILVNMTDLARTAATAARASSVVCTTRSIVR